MIVAVLLQLLDAARRGLVWTWDLSTWLVTDGWKLDLLATSLRVSWGSLRVLVGCAVGGICLGGSGSSSLFFSLALVLFFLLASLPFLADLLEFYKSDTC